MLVHNCLLILLAYGSLLAGLDAKKLQNMTYILSTNQKVFEKLFLHKNVSLLSSVPYCYTVEEETTTDGNDRAIYTDIRLDEYRKLMQAQGKFPLEITLHPEIFQLVDLNEKSETITVVLAINKQWKDCRMQWTPSDPSFTKMRVAPVMYRKLNVFTPSIRLLESIDPKESVNSETRVIVSSNGGVEIREEYTSVMSCNIDVRMYPFDIQTCYMTFESVLSEKVANMYHHLESVELESKTFLGRYAPSSVWSLAMLPPVQTRRNNCFNRDSLSCINNGLRYRFILRRVPDYQLINLLFPAFLTVVISSCVFIVPPGGGNKMDLSVTILLSLYMFSQLMYDKMPETGSTLPLLSEYFLVCIGLVTASCLYASLSSVFESASPELPNFFRSAVVNLGPIFAFDLINKRAKRTTLPDAIDSEAFRSENATGSSNEVGQFQKLNGKPDFEVARFRGFCLDEPEKLTWLAFGVLLDRLFFLVHLTVTTTVLIWYYVYGYAPWKAYTSLNLSDTEIAYMCEQLRMQNDSGVNELPCPPPRAAVTG